MTSTRSSACSNARLSNGGYSYRQWANLQLFELRPHVLQLPADICSRTGLRRPSVSVETCPCRTCVTAQFSHVPLCLSRALDPLEQIFAEYLAYSEFPRRVHEAT